jgi:hypothetical protein
METMWHNPSCRPFDVVQDKLQPASIRAFGFRQQAWIPAFAGMTELEREFICF